MEEKTIGKFITALRKANGMTQKDLAQQLNVSDKTVSRWERDEGAPDLSAIPVLAEIFGVTCDELLRGERRPPDCRSEVPSDSEITPKGEKQRRRLVKTALSQYQSRTYIAVGISVVGMIAALICNLAFLKAVLGFLLGAIFFAASLVCQAVFVNRAFLSVEDAGLEAMELSRYTRSVLRTARRSIGLTVAFLGFTFPLVLADAFVGLSADNMLLFGIPGAGAFLLLYGIVLYFFNMSQIKKGVCLLTEREAAVYYRNHRLKGICAVMLVIVLAITGLIHHTSTAIYGPYSIMSGTTFHDYESFIAYMEQDLPAQPWDTQSGTVAVDQAIAPVEDSTVYYDEFGNEISRIEAMTRRLEDINGKVVCEYVERNEQVISMTYSPKDGTVLPITVHTREDLQAARETAARRNVIFIGVYCAETAAILIAYFLKRARPIREKQR